MANFTPDGLTRREIADLITERFNHYFDSGWLRLLSQVDLSSSVSTANSIGNIAGKLTVNTTNINPNINLITDSDATLTVNNIALTETSEDITFLASDKYRLTDLLASTTDGDVARQTRDLVIDDITAALYDKLQEEVLKKIYPASSSNESANYMFVPRISTTNYSVANPQAQGITLRVMNFIAGAIKSRLGDDPRNWAVLLNAVEWQSLTEDVLSREVPIPEFSVRNGYLSSNSLFGMDIIDGYNIPVPTATVVSGGTSNLNISSFSSIAPAIVFFKRQSPNIVVGTSNVSLIESIPDANSSSTNPYYHVVMAYTVVVSNKSQSAGIYTRYDRI